MLLLRQSTAVVVQFGPFLDKTDGVTLETGLVSALDHASTGILLSKNGGTLTIRNATVTASTYDAHGCYKVTLNTTDTGTLGTLRAIYTDAATCLPVWMDFEVIPAAVYDALVNGTGTGVRSDLISVAGTNQTAGDLAALLATIAGYGDTEIAAILAAVDTEIASILSAVDTEVAAIQTAANSILTAVDTEVASVLSAVDTEVAAILAAVDTEIGAIKSVTDKMDTALVLDGAVYQFTTNALELGPGGGGGTTYIYGEQGSITFTYTVYDTDTVTPLAGVAVWVSSDIAGTNRSQTKLTDALGRVQFDLDASTIYVWRSRGDRAFTNPDTETVS